MREIKFRGKRKDSEKWETGYVILTSQQAAIMRIIEGEDGCPLDDEICEVDPASVGQFTGLLDENSREIYEGDMVRYYHGETLFIDFTGVIRFEEGCFYLCHADGDGKLALSGLFVQGMRVQVVGNVHDQPRADISND